MLLGNLPPKFRSQLYCIQLVALCMSHTIKNNGYKKILEPSIIDLKTLKTEGIYVSKSDGDHTLFWHSKCCDCEQFRSTKFSRFYGIFYNPKELSILFHH